MRRSLEKPEVATEIPDYSPTISLYAMGLETPTADMTQSSRGAGASPVRTQRPTPAGLVGLGSTVWLSAVSCKVNKKVNNDRKAKTQCLGEGEPLYERRHALRVKGLRNEPGLLQTRFGELPGSPSATFES